MDEQFLDDCWTLYFHDPDDSEWTKNSYKVIGSVSTVHDWAEIDVSFHEMWTKGMFFLMREHIQPLWEDPYNRDGGCFSFKVNKPEASSYLFKLCSQMLGNSLAKSSEAQAHTSICGISMSPKRNYCIIRIWIGDKTYNKVSLYNIDLPNYTQILFKNHEENIDFAVDPSPVQPVTSSKST
jgi:hypothetical protein